MQQAHLAHDFLQHVLTQVVARRLQLLDHVPVSLRDRVVRPLVAAAELLVLGAELQVPLRLERRLEVQALRVSRCWLDSGRQHH